MAHAGKTVLSTISTTRLPGDEAVVVCVGAVSPALLRCEADALWGTVGDWVTVLGASPVVPCCETDVLCDN